MVQTERYIGYGAMHGRVRKAKGSACLYTCVHCEKQAQDWSYDHNDANELRESAYGLFSRNIDHYIPLCCKCHAKFDNRGKKKTYEKFDTALYHT